MVHCVAGGVAVQLWPPGWAVAVYWLTTALALAGGVQLTTTWPLPMGVACVAVGAPGGW